MFSKKMKLIYIAIIFVFCTVFSIICLFLDFTLDTFVHHPIKLYRDLSGESLFYIIEVCAMSFNLALLALCIKFGFENLWFLIPSIILSIGLGAMGIYAVVAQSPCGIVLFFVGLLSSVGYWLLLFFLKSLNINFKGKPPLTFKRKVLEVLLQIALVPFSAFLQVCYLAIIVPFFYPVVMLPSLLMRTIVYNKIKKEGLDKGYWHNVGASDTLVATTTTHEIRATDGTAIATYDTTEYSVEHDSGDRYEESEQETFARWHALIALPCRIVALILSVVALFIPKMYVSAFRPKTEYKFNRIVFRFIDVIIFN